MMPSGKPQLASVCKLALRNSVGIFGCVVCGAEAIKARACKSRGKCLHMDVSHSLEMNLTLIVSALLNREMREEKNIFVFVK